MCARRKNGRRVVPDLKDTPSKLLTLSWKLPPNYELNPHFAQQFDAQDYLRIRRFSLRAAQAVVR